MEEREVNCMLPEPHTSKKNSLVLLGNFLLIPYLSSCKSQTILRGSLSWETVLAPRCRYACTSLRCHYVHQKRHPAPPTWLSRTVQFRCNMVTSFKQTILPLSIFFSRVKHKWGSDDALYYVQPEWRTWTCTYQMSLWSFKGSLDDKAYYKSYHAAFFRVCFSLKDTTHWRDHSLNRIIDDS